VGILLFLLGRDRVPVRFVLGEAGEGKRSRKAPVDRQFATSSERDIGRSDQNCKAQLRSTEGGKGGHDEREAARYAKRTRLGGLEAVSAGAATRARTFGSYGCSENNGPAQGQPETPGRGHVGAIHESRRRNYAQEFSRQEHLQIAGAFWSMR